MNAGLEKSNSFGYARTAYDTRRANRPAPGEAIRAHAQPHLRADQPAYISSCHTHTRAHSQIGCRQRLFCTGAPTQCMEPRAKRGCIDPEHITASFPEEVRTYEEWATYPVDVLQLVCSQVGLAPSGSKHEMALRLVVFSNWRARAPAPQAAPERLLQGTMMAPGRPRADTQLRWPPCRLSRSPWLSQ